MTNSALDWVFSRAIPEPNSGCYLWLEGLNSGGYGKHRKVYEMLCGPVPGGLDLDHTCRQRSCVNPDHLEPVTHSRNMRRGRFQRRAAACCKHGHEWTAENTMVRVVQDQVNGDRYKRQCRACTNASHRESTRRRYREARGGNVKPKAADRTHCPQGHEYTPENTGYSNLPTGYRVRWCRQCKRDKEVARGPRIRDWRAQYVAKKASRGAKARASPV